MDTIRKLNEINVMISKDETDGCQRPVRFEFTSREVTAWGGLALLKRMLDGLDFKSALRGLGLPQPGSNRDYAPEQLIEQINYR